MCNPKVQEHLFFFPEDTGNSLEEARQAACWLHKMKPDDATPMVQIKNLDYFIHEPTMLVDGICCIPTCWFTRKGLFYACAWKLSATTSGWIVHRETEIEISQNQLLKNFPRFCDDHREYRLSILDSR